MPKHKVTIESLCVKEPQDTKTTQSHILPIYASSSFCFDTVEDSIDVFTGKATGHVYSRYGNPTIDTVALKLATLEAFGIAGLDPFCFLTSSGMSAISTLCLALLKSGDTILTQGNLYGGTTELFLNILSNYGIQTKLVTFNDLNEVEHHVKNDPSIKLMFMETPSNPTTACVDLEGLASICKKHKLFSVIDNTFCTPLLQQPFKFGIDFVIHSTTKYLNGHGNSISGAIVGRSSEYKQAIWRALKLIGSTCNPFDAWLLHNGLKTLPLRIHRHSDNAMHIATRLEQHPKIEKVNYCGLPSHPDHHIASKQMVKYGGMLSIDIKGGKDKALQFMNALQLATQAPTLGDVDTLVLHPATSSHLQIDPAIRSKNGITDGLVRISVGIENVTDILEDIEQALN